MNKYLLTPETETDEGPKYRHHKFGELMIFFFFYFLGGGGGGVLTGI